MTLEFPVDLPEANILVEKGKETEKRGISMLR